jgi:succinate dehydrogenase / fumarate reductase cytochrome b subunit
MSHSTATRARPVSPHLGIYRFKPTMTMSILHRIAGGALYFGTLLLAAWLIAAATSQIWFDRIDWLYGSWFGRLVLLFYSWVLIHHMLGGIRHLIWDTGMGLGKDASTRLAMANIVASIVLTILVWIAGYMARGAL